MDLPPPPSYEEAVNQDFYSLSSIGNGSSLPPNNYEAGICPRENLQPPIYTTQPPNVNFSLSSSSSRPVNNVQNGASRIIMTQPLESENSNNPPAPAEHKLIPSPALTIGISILHL